MRFLLLLGVSLVCVSATALAICYYPRPLGEVRAEATVPAGEPTKEIKNSIDMRLVRIPAGKFLMGSPKEEVYRNDDETQHEVVITKAFYMGVFEITQGQYDKVMSENPAFFSAKGGGKQRVQGRNTADYPVERVAYLDAVEFCKKLSDKEKKTYRLPTEAEWEYACRAGTKTVFHTGNDFNSVLANINGLVYSSYGKEVAGPFHRCTVKVGDYKANAFGLFDMHGNVQEWCADWYGEDYYTKSPKEDPQGPAEGTKRILRGGGWPSSAKACRSALRHQEAPDEKSYTSGFRVVLEVK